MEVAVQPQIVLRAQPATDSAVVRTILYGNRLEVATELGPEDNILGQKGHWRRVASGEGSSWVFDALLRYPNTDKSLSVVRNVLIPTKNIFTAEAIPNIEREPTAVTFPFQWHCESKREMTVLMQPPRSGTGKARQVAPSFGDGYISVPHCGGPLTLEVIQWQPQERTGLISLKAEEWAHPVCHSSSCEDLPPVEPIYQGYYEITITLMEQLPPFQNAPHYRATAEFSEMYTKK